MNPLIFVLLSVGGGLGAALRLLLDGIIRDRLRWSYPVGTTVINVSGSLVLGMITASTMHGLLPVEGQLILGTGLMGGYTTFSTASFETVRLVREGEYVAGLVNGLGMLITAVLAALLGLWIGSLL